MAKRTTKKTSKAVVAEDIGAAIALAAAKGETLTVPEFIAQETKQDQIERAWAQHTAVNLNAGLSPEEIAEAELLDKSERKRDNLRRNDEGKIIYFANREEIEDCYKRVVLEKPRKPKVIFANREEINECYARVVLRPQMEKRKAKELERHAAQVSHLGDLPGMQMLAKLAKAA